MVGESDNRDRAESRRLAVVLVSLVALVGLGALFMLPMLGDIVATQLEPGLGLRDAAVIAFFTTAILFIVFAIAAGDGLLGELQFMLGGFFLFFAIFWLLIAWVF
ncbi:hypothetical protein [Chromatocurvus halotolerans]|uniref:Uncharacterized protein n=1 Tax=Chromatocurvus halotolerans TaxID=1132028 RepID=A0A4R2KTK4_9GAMM|nr:hypothetical protein [Chromatocurvus halotolerans]TCO76107.1 hypothetical protein EV688_10567 [Chromatocurvus halotolerans]